jgi:hypothetical protein
MDETLLTCSVCFFIYTCFLLIGSLCSIIDTVEYMYALFALGMPMFACYVFPLGDRMELHETHSQSAHKWIDCHERMSVCQRKTWGVTETCRSQEKTSFLRPFSCAARSVSTSIRQVYSSVERKAGVSMKIRVGCTVSRRSKGYSAAHALTLFQPQHTARQRESHRPCGACVKFGTRSLGKRSTFCERIQAHIEVSVQPSTPACRVLGLVDLEQDHNTDYIMPSRSR